MHCDQMEELIAAYADGELQGEQKQQLEAHLAECPHCAELYREYLAISKALAGCEKRAPEDLCDKVMQTIREQNTAPVKQTRGIRLGRAAGWIGVGVAAMLCISVASTALVRYIVLHPGNMDADSIPEEMTTAGGIIMPEQATLPEDTAADHATMEEITTEELSMDESPTVEENEADGTTREPAGVDPMETVAPEETEQEGTRPVVTQPESEEPSAEQATEPPTEDAGGKDDEEVEDTYPSYAPDTDAATDVAPEDNAAKGWLGRMLEAIGTFFEVLWDGLVSLLGGDGHA